MGWVVDTCVIIDVLDDDPKFGRSSALALKGRLADGLIICPVTVIELSPAFDGNLAEQKQFLKLCGVNYDEAFASGDADFAHSVWAKYIFSKRLGNAGKRPIADIMIGAFASRFQGLITRNPKDFSKWFPKLRIISPQ